MKQKKQRPKLGPPAILMAVLLGSLIGASSVLCMASAFSLPCRIAVILVGCLLFSLLAAGIMAAKPVVPLSLTVLAVYVVALILLRTQLIAGALSTLSHVTAAYHACYDFIPILGAADGDCTLFLLALAMPLSWLTAYIVCRWAVSAFWVLLACLPILTLCLIIVDVAPVFWLTVLTGSLLLLLLPHSVRTVAPNEGGRLGWWLLLPTIILVAAITVLWPPAAYERASWSDTLQAFAEAKLHLQQLGTTVLYEGPRWSPELKEVDLQQLGPRVNTGEEALRYRTTASVSYLRGVSLGVYEDNAWKAVPQSEFLAQTFATPPLTAEATRLEPVLSTVEIETAAPKPVLYVPYFLDTIPISGQAVDDAYVKNQDGVKSYSAAYRTGAPIRVLYQRDYDAYVRQQYLQLPQPLAPQLRTILRQAGLSGATPAQIADYVKNLAEYDLDTPAIPADEDFVLYFLRQSRRGYCVHFATAATLLLRASGYPARYVTGYAVSGEENIWNTVSEDDAHAWVEYYTTENGWQPLDPTPPANRPQADPVEPMEPDQPETPEPPPAEPDKPEAKPAPTEPESSSQNGIGGASTASTSPSPLLWLLLLPVLAVLPPLRRTLVLSHRRDRCTKGDPNRRALFLWRWLCRLSKADGTPLPESLLSLAEKAKFSQHTLSVEELDLLTAERDRRIAALQQTDRIKKLWHAYRRVLLGNQQNY